MEYEPMFDDVGERRECSCCGYFAPLAKFENVFCEGRPERRDFYFCEICASTHISKSVEYPSQFEDRYALQAMAWIGNKILEEIRIARAADPVANPAKMV